MKVLVACEFSGIVRDAFLALGHNALSCDLLPTERPGPHYKGDVMDILDDGWDLMIAHPPCQHLSYSGVAWFKEKIKNGLQQSAVDFFMALVNAPIPKIAIENPQGIMSQRFRKPDQVINPFEFGHRERKRTCLWLKNIPVLMYTELRIPQEPIFIDRSNKKRYFVDALSRSKERSKIRSRTFQGIANAMAEQWG
jgi:site-specific DNA-cytosine methylase